MNYPLHFFKKLRRSVVCKNKKTITSQDFFSWRIKCWIKRFWCWPVQIPTYPNKTIPFLHLWTLIISCTASTPEQIALSNYVTNNIHHIFDKMIASMLVCSCFWAFMSTLWKHNYLVFVESFVGRKTSFHQHLGDVEFKPDRH